MEAWIFNAEPMVVQEINRNTEKVTRVIKHRFEAYLKLNPKIHQTSGDGISVVFRDTVPCRHLLYRILVPGSYCMV